MSLLPYAAAGIACGMLGVAAFRDQPGLAALLGGSLSVTVSMLMVAAGI